MIGRSGRRDVIALAALGSAAVGIPLWLAAAAGAIGIPSNDDWVYMRAAENLFRTGSPDMPGHTAAFIGQLVLVQPLLWLSGGAPWAFTAFGLVMGLVGVAATYLLARRFVGTGAAVLVVLLVLAFPGFARETASFMTDGPACAFAMVCLLLGTVWLQGGRRATLVAALAAGLLAVSIREFAVAAPAAILVAAWARHRADERAWLAGVSIALVVGVVGVLVVAGSTPGHSAPTTVGLRYVHFLGPAVATLSAVVLPAAVLAMGRRIATFSPYQLILGAGLACLLVLDASGPLLGNIWMPYGLAGNSLLSGIRKLVIDAPPWALSEQLALVATILVAALATRWGVRRASRIDSLSAVVAVPMSIARSREGPLVLFLLAYAAELAAFALLGRMFDRYLYPMVPAAAILLLRWPSRPFSLGRGLALTRAAIVPLATGAFVIAAFAWLAVSAFVIAANSFAYDAARFRAGEAAVAMGYDARTVDAGLEWVGTHSSGNGNPVSAAYGLTAYDDRSDGVPSMRRALEQSVEARRLRADPCRSIRVSAVPVLRPQEAVVPVRRHRLPDVHSLPQPGSAVTEGPPVQWLPSLAAEFAITVSNGGVWVSIGEALLFGAVSLAVRDLGLAIGRSSPVRCSRRGDPWRRPRVGADGPGRLVGSDLVRRAELVHAGCGWLRRGDRARRGSAGTTSRGHGRPRTRNS